MRTEFARSVRKDRGFNILQYEKQTRLMNCLLYATSNFTEHLPIIFAEKVVFKNMN